MRVYLTGYMYSGKTTVGHKLATRKMELNDRMSSIFYFEIC